MPSPLETHPGTDDYDPVPDLSNGSRPRRDKRSHHAVLSSSAVTAAPPSTVALPFILLYNILLALLHIILRPISSVREFVESERKTDEVLKTLPKEQAKQRQDLRRVGMEQEILKDRMEDLKRRVQKIEERRKRSTEEAEARAKDAERAREEMKERSKEAEARTKEVEKQNEEVMRWAKEEAEARAKEAERQNEVTGNGTDKVQQAQ